jgi:hypothetical protein
MLADFLARLRNSAARTFAPLIALIATLALSLFLGHQGALLPSGAISLQRAWDSETATKIVQSWSALKSQATAQVLWDFLFIVAYSYLLFAFGSAAARDAGNRGQPRLARFATCAAAAGLLAGCCDVIENIGLLTMIWLMTEQPLPALTWLASSAKFSLIGFSFLASLVTLLWPVRRPAV